MQFKAHILSAVSIALLGSALAFSGELDALLYKALTSYYSVTQASLTHTCLATAFIALLPLVLFNSSQQIHTLVGICLYLIYVLIFLTISIFIFQIWLPPIKILLAVFIAYLLWVALRAKTVQSSMDFVLQNMRNELIRLGMESEEDSYGLPDISQQSRVSKLMLTMQHLRDLHKSRNDALMFISHDIRTPLNAAILLLDKFEKTKDSERMHQLLARANLMAEGFVHATRAESADVNKFKVIDMVSLTQQVIDDLYELIHAKYINLQTDFLNDHIWVRGDFGLLFRTVSNLLLNAVNYSPDNSVVKVCLSADGDSLALKIIDQGPGIPESKISKLFKRFSRVDEEYQAMNGCGLGLYFVNITVKKHRGSVAVRNLANRGAEFLVKLPLERRKINLDVPHERRVQVQP